MQIGEKKKSSASGGNDGCLYVERTASGYVLTETEDPSGAVRVPQVSWDAFKVGVVAGEFD